MPSRVLQVETADGCFLAPPERAVRVPAALAHSIHNIGPAQMRSLYVQAGTPGLPTQCQVLEIPPLLRELVLAVCALPEHYDEAGPEGRLVAVTLDQLAQARPAALDLPCPPMPGCAGSAAPCRPTRPTPAPGPSGARRWA